MADPTPVAAVTHNLVMKYGDPDNPTTVGLMIPGGDTRKYAREPYTPFAPATRQGEATIRDFSIAATWELNNDWSGGTGHLREQKVESNTYSFARGLNVDGAIGTCLYTAQKGRILPAPASVADQTIHPSGTLQSVKQFIEFDSKLFCLTSDAAGKIYVLDTSDNQWTLEETLTAAGTQLYTDGTTLYACQGAANLVRKRATGVVGTAWSNHTFNANYIAARADGTLAYIATATLTPGGAYSATGVGWSGTTATNLLALNDILWVFKPEGVYTWTEAKVEKRLDLEKVKDDSNGLKAVVYNNMIYTNVKNRLYMLTKESYIEIFPQDMGGFSAINALTPCIDGLLIGAKMKPKQSVNAATAATSPGTLANDATYGSIAWLNPSNAASSNNQYATMTAPAVAESQYLKATNFGFAIPASAGITGVMVEIERKASLSVVFVRDSVVRLVTASGIVGSNRAKTNNWEATDTYSSHGGVSDNWDVALTPAIINASTFGAVLSATVLPMDANPHAFVDHIRITVYYSVPEGENNYIFFFKGPNEPGLNPLWSDADGSLPIAALCAAGIFSSAQTRVYFCTSDTTIKVRYIDLNERMLPNTYDVSTTNPSYLDFTDFSALFRTVKKWFYEIVLTVDNPNTTTFAKVYYSIDGAGFQQVIDDAGAAVTLTLDARTKGAYLPLDTSGTWCQVRIYTYTTVATNPASITTVTLRGVVMVRARYQLAFPVDCSPTVMPLQGNPESGDAIKAHIRAAAAQTYPVKIQDPDQNWHLCLFRTPSPLEAIQQHTLPDIQVAKNYPVVQMTMVEIDPLDSDGSLPAWSVG